MHCISRMPFLFCFLLLSLISLFVGVTPIYLLLLLLSSHCSHWLWQFLIYAAVEQQSVCAIMNIFRFSRKTFGCAKRKEA